MLLLHDRHASDRLCNGALPNEILNGLKVLERPKAMAYVNSTIRRVVSYVIIAAVDKVIDMTLDLEKFD